MVAGRFRPKLNTTFVIVLGTLALLVISPVYYAQTQGVCLKSARVLSEEELRKTVLANMVNNTIVRSFQSNRASGNDDSWVGINSPAQETDIKKIIDASYNNGKSFEENFGLTVLVAGNNTKKYETFTPDQLIEPFIFMTYTHGRRDSSAWFLVSQDVKEVSLDSFDEKLRESAIDQATFLQKLLGYGNHYFKIYFPSWFIFGQDCCDNSNQDMEDYQENKRNAYSQALESITTQAEIAEVVPIIASVSNCGDISVTITTGGNFY
jgi:hypothetical protein